MHNDIKLLTGPKVNLNMINNLQDKFHWPKVADFKLHDFGQRGVGGARGIDALVNIGFQHSLKEPTIGELWERWRGLPKLDNIQMKGRFLRSPGEGFVIHHENPWFVPAGVGRINKLKTIKKRPDNVGALVARPDGFKFEFPKIEFGIGPFKVRHHKTVVVGKPNPVEALKAFWKDAQGPKPGLGYDHPHQKGLFRGRDHRGRDVGNLVHMGDMFDRYDRCAVGRGLYYDYARAVVQQPDPEEFKRLQEEQERIAAQREAARQETQRKRKLKNQMYKRICNQLANDMLSNLNKPGIDVTKQIAWYFSEVRFYGHGLRYIAVDTLTARLKEQGFTYLGEGAWSSAFLSPDGWVYKVNCNSDVLDGWLAYAVNVKLNGSSKNFPQIDTITRMGLTYCAKIEKLEPLTGDEQQEFRDRNDGKMKAFQHSQLSTIRKEFNCSGDDAINLFEVVRNTCDEIKGTYDIHPGNVMWRVDNDVKTLVLTDPLCGGSFDLDKVCSKLAA